MPNVSFVKMTMTGVHELGNASSKELDDANLARMGKRPVLKVRNSIPLNSVRVKFFGLLTHLAKFWTDVHVGI